MHSYFVWLLQTIEKVLSAYANLIRKDFQSCTSKHQVVSRCCVATFPPCIAAGNRDERALIALLVLLRVLLLLKWLITTL